MTSATPDEISSVAAKIADASLYRQNNLTYPGVLARARERVEVDRWFGFVAPSGQPFIRAAKRSATAGRMPQTAVGIPPATHLPTTNMSGFRPWTAV